MGKGGGKGEPESQTAGPAFACPHLAGKMGRQEGRWIDKRTVRRFRGVTESFCKGTFGKKYGLP